MVAAAVLLLTAAAVSGVVSASLRARGVEAARGQLEQALQTELSRLAALPYATPVAPPPGQGYDPAAARSLVQAVFPHAGVVPDLPQAYFTPGTATEAEEFTTVATTAWGRLRTQAEFVCWGGGGWDETGGGGCLLQVVFPHAGVVPNLPQAFFAPGTAGSPDEFTTVATTAWGKLRTRAVFVCWGGDGWVPAAGDQLSGWAVWQRQVPPAPALRVTVEALDASGRRASLTTVLCGDAPRVADPEAPS